MQTNLNNPKILKMSNKHELPPERIPGHPSYRDDLEIQSNPVADGVVYDNQRGRKIKYEGTGILYVRQPHKHIPFTDFMPAKPGDVGRDLPVRIKGMQNIEPSVRISPYRDYYLNFDEGWVDIPADGYAELPSGIYVKVPDDAWGLIKTRSSTGWRRKLYVFEGTIDLYIGMLCCLVYNPHQEPVRITDGEKLAQFVLIPKYKLERQVYCDELPETARGDTGFGSTGN